MGFYDAFKDVLNMAQKVDNIDLYRQLLDLSAQALEMQEEIIKLKAENKELKSQKDIEDDIEYHVDPFITRKSDKNRLNIVYVVATIAICQANIKSAKATREQLEVSKLNLKKQSG